MRKVEKLATEHTRFIGKLAYSYWSRLPLHAKAFIDVEDLIGGAVCCVVEKAKLHDDTISKPVTFVGMITIHYLENELNRFEQGKRKAVGVVEIEEWNTPLTADSMIRWNEAKNGFEMLIEFGSDELRLALDSMLHERKFPKQRVNGELVMKPSLVEELQKLTRRCGVSRSQMEDVFAAV